MTALAMLAAFAGPALAQGAKPRTVAPESCTAKAAPPPGMEGWTHPTPEAASLSEAGLDKAPLTPGRAVIARFAPVGQVRYRVPPERADGPPTYGGLYRLTVAEAGIYRVAAGAAPWVDVFDGTTPAKTARFGHGPACTGIGKMVEFPLQPGTYLVQFSESLEPTTEILVVKTRPGDAPPQR